MIDANPRHCDTLSTLTLVSVMRYSLRKTIRSVLHGRIAVFGSGSSNRGAAHPGVFGDRVGFLGVAGLVKGAAAQVRAVNVGYGC